MNKSRPVNAVEGDPHSFPRPEQVSLRHIDLDLDVDFENRRITGHASLHLNPHNTRELIVDTRNLDIQRVTVGASHTDTEFRLIEEVDFLGQPLSIKLPATSDVVHIEYMTQGDSAAVQWLDPLQTTDARHPFLFTQSQTICARTWFPCQDTPGVRTTYHARVKVPKGLMAVMSAQNPTVKNIDGVYEFRAKRPISSYLFALAVGDLEFRALGLRSGVYAERAVLARAAYEFADIETMMRAAEKLYGRYRWDRLDLIVLPPSFPFGGMENPQLVFVTPSLLAGDRSLTSIVAHELAHAWSGNLVTNATWNDFWLNEGFSVYTEHRIMEEVYGRKYDDMLAVLGLRSLKREMMALPARDTWLYLDLRGRHPNDCFTEVPYEKGYLFLRMLEEHFGSEQWNRFLNQYFDTFAFQSMDSSRFIAFLHEHLIRGDKNLEERLDIEKWLYGPGLPKNCPIVHSVELDRVDAQVGKFESGTRAEKLCTSAWTTHHWVYFLTSLKRPLQQPELENLDATFRFTETGNAEILYNWLLLCIPSNYESADAALETLLVRQGRLKYLKAIYRELGKTPSGKKKAERIYRLARAKYHSAVVHAIDSILTSESQ